MSFVILQDTREREPWNFEFAEACKQQKIQKLNTGDYQIEGHPFLITIDRKKSVVELANNLVRDYERFCRELERMKEYRFAYILCEFPYSLVTTFPKGSRLPRFVRRRMFISGRFLCSRLSNLIDNYGVDFIFCTNRFEAQNKAIDLFLEAYDIEQTEED